MCAAHIGAHFWPGQNDISEDTKEAERPVTGWVSKGPGSQRSLSAWMSVYQQPVAVTESLRTPVAVGAVSGRCPQ